MQINEATQVQQFESTLKQRGMRITSVRREIFYILLNATRPLSTQEIVASVSSAHFVSVYRTLDTLHALGVVKQVPQGFKYLYELSDMFNPHHHHATCERCGTTVEVHSAKIETLMKQITIEAGLLPTRHQFEAYGLCKKCQARRAQRIA